MVKSIHKITQFLKSAGFDIVILETVGVGQSEVEVASVANVTLLVLVPEAGDDIQMMKSGLFEVANIFVVNKSDRADAKKSSTPATSFSIEEITLAIELKLPSATSFFKFSIWNI